LRILITGANSSTALKLLKAFNNYQIVLADYGDVPNLKSSTYNLISLGVKNEETIAHNLLNFCLDEAVDVVLPIHSYEIEAVAKAEILFNEFNIKVLLPKAEELIHFLKPDKTTDWAVFDNGKLLFSTNHPDSLQIKGKGQNLNGVFYFIKEVDLVTFNLITI
jgi:hypothetical protein